MQLTLEIDEKVLNKIRKIAEAQDTTVSAMVNEYLASLAEGESDDRKAQAASLMATFERLSRDMGPRGWTRDDLYEERLGRYGG